MSYLYCWHRPHWSLRWGARVGPELAWDAAAGAAPGTAGARRRTAGTAATEAGGPAAPRPPRTAAAAPAARPPAPCRRCPSRAAPISCPPAHLRTDPMPESHRTVCFLESLRRRHYTMHYGARVASARYYGVLGPTRRARHCHGAPGGGATYPPYPPPLHKLILRLLHIIDLFLRQYIAPAAKRFQTLCHEVTDLY